MDYYNLESVVRAPTLSPALSSSLVKTEFLGSLVETSTGPTRLQRLGEWCRQHRWALHGGMAAATVSALLVGRGCSGAARTMGVVSCAAASALAEWCCRRAPVLGQTPAMVEQVAAHVLGVDDVTTINGVVAEVEVEKDADLKEISAGLRKWVQKTKLHFGEVRDTPADQLCVKKWLAEQMKEADVRDKDARGMIPMVAFLATVPDSDDAVAANLRYSAVVRNMRIFGGGRAPRA